MTSKDFDDQVASIAALGEPVRRALYRYVIAQPEPVSRERAAAGVGVAHHVAKFHLDRLEEDGLLDVEYSRPPGRSGPGAGRPAKLYRRSSRQIAVSLPERRYDVAGHILAEAITVAQQTGEPVDRCLRAAAAAAGCALGEQARRIAEERANPGDPLGIVAEVLAANGYEPRPAPGCLTLANCPFHSLAENYATLICGMNLDFVNGVLSVLPAADVQAQLDPSPNRCCVMISKTPT